LTLELLQLWNSLVYHELFYQIFVKLFPLLDHLKFRAGLFIPALHYVYFSMNCEAFFFMAEFQ
jgi:hypothetical protein